MNWGCSTEKTTKRSRDIHVSNSLSIYWRLLQRRMKIVCQTQEQESICSPCSKKRSDWKGGRGRIQQPPGKRRDLRTGIDWIHHVHYARAYVRSDTAIAVSLCAPLLGQVGPCSSIFLSLIVTKPIQQKLWGKIWHSAEAGVKVLFITDTYASNSSPKIN